jgi:histone H3/H4
MPKSPSRTSKKKKYNSRFPPARIKKIMQTDEEVGKVAAAVPVIISRALELFIESLITETCKTTITKNAKTLSTSHIKQTIETNKQFDFLRDLVVSIPDHQAEDNGDMTAHDGESTGKKARGRPRKPKEMKEGGRSRGESSKASSNTSEEEDDEEDDEDTETDDEGSVLEAAASVESTSSVPSGTKSVFNSQPNFQSWLPQASSTKAEMSFHPPSYQQQYFSSNLPTYIAPPYSPYIPSASQGMVNYSTPPQFVNSHPLMMPSPQHHVLQAPGAHHQLSDQQQFHSQTQPQPMNLSYSWSAATTTNGNDDYDT